MSVHHELLLSPSVQRRSDGVASFVSAGIEADEKVVAFLGDRTADLVQAAVGPSPLLAVHSAQDRPLLPAVAMHLIHGLVESAREEQRKIRIIGEMLDTSPWWAWRRYEAAVNLRTPPDTALMCVYDEGALPADVVEDLLATHQFGGRSVAHAPNPAYRDPLEVVSGAPDPPPHPCEASRPLVEVVDPSPAEARALVHRTGEATALEPGAVTDLALATSEIVANAAQYGLPPVSVRVWAADDEVVVGVTDRGPGPTDPLLGLGPTARRPGGLGLWISHQLVEVAHSHRPEGFTVTLRLASQAG